MARLPIPGSDKGSWGQILNDYLSAVHNADGTLKTNAVNTSTLTDDGVTEAKLAPAVRTKLNSVGGAVGATGPSGAAGPAGATGPSGATGAAGAAGPAGATGPSGAAGPAGATGPSGAAGTSVTITGSVANAAALPGGLGAGDIGVGYITQNDGHLHVWLGSSWSDVGEVRGPAGATGPSGAAGAAGAAGPAGATGPSGAAGPAGATGPSGAAGATGPQGPAGTGGGSMSWNFRTITNTDATAVSGDFIIAEPFTQGITITLPTPTVNAVVRIKRRAVTGNGIQIIATGGAYIDDPSVGSATVNPSWQFGDLVSDGTNWYRS